jgi:N-acetylated-alpha-linked acidic dipeptidase
MTLAAAAGSEPASMFGFSAADGAREAALEQRFDAALDPAELRGWLKTLSAEPNHVGSPHDKANAERVRDLFKQWGWDAHIEVFDVLYPTLKQHTLELVAPTRFTASLTEPPIEGDATSTRTDGLPPYNEYGADGDVTGDLVYLNYGMPEDYRALARRGIDVRGKIVITRYGKGWRGLKPKLAQEHGAIACLIYSDPRDDGYSKGDIYPKGGWRPPAGVQRGSVLDMAVYPGDPLTPGVGATKDAKRLPISEARTILKIPVMPVSYADAQPLLAALPAPSLRRSGVGRSPSPTTWDRAPRACTSRFSPIGVSSPSTMLLRRSRARRHRTSGWCAATIAMAGCSAPGIRSRGKSRSLPRPRRSAGC